MERENAKIQPSILGDELGKFYERRMTAEEISRQMLSERNKISGIDKFINKFFNNHTF